MMLLWRAWRRLKSAYGNMFSHLSLRAAGRPAGTGTRFLDCTYFRFPASVTIGRDCLLCRGVVFSAETTRTQVVLGDRVQVNDGVFLDYTGGLALKDDVLISEDAILYTHDHGLDPHAPPVSYEKTVEAHAWIGARALILPGCQRIGAHAVIGAGAVVTKDVPARTIVAGNPARVIGEVPTGAQKAPFDIRAAE